MSTKKRSIRNRLLYALEYAVARAVAGLVGFLPRSWRLSLGAAVAGFFFHLNRRRREIALQNLDHAFGEEKAPNEKRAIALEAFQHFGTMFFELMTLGKPSWPMLEKMVDFRGIENYARARSRCRGVIMVSSHFGNWELQGICHGYRLGPMSVVAREQDNPHLNRWLENLRTISGNTVIYKQQAISRMRRALKNGETVGFVIDQNVRLEDAVFVDFFGRQAATTPVASWFALKTGAALVPVFCWPLPDGRYCAVYEEEVDLQPFQGLDEPEALHGITQRLTSVIETYVRRAPEMWLWMHRRWKTRPPGEGKPSK